MPLALRSPSLAAMALTAMTLFFANGAAACEGPLTGRSLTVEPLADFGKVQGLPLLPLEAGEYVVTIDDGPNPATTPQLLDALDAACVKATFFLLGKRSREHPELAREIVARGHTVGSHSFSHPNLRKLDEAGIAKQIDLGVKWVEESAYGESLPKDAPRLLRFPGAAGPTPVTSPELVEMAHRRGLTVAGYDFSPQDWRNSLPEESFARLFPKIGDRGVIVFHDGQPNTIRLLPMVFEEMKRRGARVVGLALPAP